MDEKQVLIAFQRFDDSGNGIIEKSELYGIMLDLGWEGHQIDYLLNAMDANADGLVEYEEFLKWIFGPDRDTWAGTEFRKALESQQPLPVDGPAAPYSESQSMAAMSTDKLITQLLDSLDKLRDSGYGGSNVFEQLKQVKGLIELCKGTQRQAEDILQTLTLQVQVVKMGGDIFQVKARPDETVLKLKDRITSVTGIPSFKQVLVASESGEVLNSMERLYNYNLAGGVSMTVVDPSPDLKLWVACSEEEDFRIDVVSGKRCDLVLDWYDRGEGFGQPVEKAGRRGVELQGENVLKLPEAIKLEGGPFTISMWMHFPVGKHPPPDFYGDMIPQPACLFNIVENRHKPFPTMLVIDSNSLLEYDLMGLEGWHHICEVIANDGMNHYVDGELVGEEEMAQYAKDVIECSSAFDFLGVACRPDPSMKEGCSVFSDVKLFSTPLDADRVKSLAQNY